MKFSVIIPSFLGEYQHAASNREMKLVRAVDSVLAQNFTDYEIIVVADGCEKSYNMICDKYPDNDTVDCLLIPKQPIWSGKPRNEGIKKAKGEYIIYLDADDMWGESHLNIINAELDQYNNPDWVWFNDLLMEKDGRKWERQILINQRFQNGTSNICHKRVCAVEWKGTGYGFDDWNIVTQLQRYKSAKIKTPQYYVCHLPNKLDV